MVLRPPRVSRSGMSRPPPLMGTEVMPNFPSCRCAPRPTTLSGSLGILNPANPGQGGREEGGVGAGVWQPLGPEAGPPGVGGWLCHLLLVCPWVCRLASLCLGFSFCLPPPKTAVKVKNKPGL